MRGEQLLALLPSPISPLAHLKQLRIVFASIFSCICFLLASMSFGQTIPDAETALEQFVDTMAAELKTEFKNADQKIAVLAIVHKDSGTRWKLSEEWEDLLSQVLIRNKSYPTIPPYQIEELKAEWGNDQRFSTKKALEDGRRIRADWVVTGNFREFPELKYTRLSLTLTDSQSGEPLYTGNIKISKESIPVSLLAPLSAPKMSVIIQSGPLPTQSNKTKDLFVVYEYSLWSEFDITINGKSLKPIAAEESFIESFLSGSTVRVQINDLLTKSDNRLAWEFKNRGLNQRDSPHCIYQVELVSEKTVLYQDSFSEFNNCSNVEIAKQIVIPQKYPTTVHIQPPHESGLKPYYIDRAETSVKHYDDYLVASGLPKLGEIYKKHPVTDITWNQAKAYCEWQKKRLPTKPEWLYAAYGSTDSPYPWGDDDPDGGFLGKALANFEGDSDNFEQVAPVDSFLTTSSPFGLLNALGNVSEWTSSFENDQYHVLGGSWKDQSEPRQIKQGQLFPPSTKASHVGVRCAADQ